MSIHIIAETRVIDNQIADALKVIGAPEWGDNQEFNNDAEVLTEFAGRLCYKSFIPGLNPNVTKVREGNAVYIKNLLGQKHGSVLEHSSVSVLFLGVSRIFTHELVRHRAGVAISQESQRFVRLDSFDLYVPDLTEAFDEIAETIGKDRSWSQEKQAQYLNVVEQFSKFGEEKIVNLIEEFALDEPGVSFHAKKQITSALRRLIPGGVLTNILITANHRAMRYILGARSTSGAEQEMREIQYPLAQIMLERYPNIYQDMYYDFHKGEADTELKIPEVKFHNEKV